MPVAPGPSRRFVLLLIGASFFICFIFVASFRSQAQGVRHPLAHGSGSAIGLDTVQAAHVDIQASTLTGHVIAPKLGNETAKYAIPQLLLRSLDHGIADAYVAWMLIDTS